MVFGEADATVKENDDELVVEVRGVDVYDAARLAPPPGRSGSHCLYHLGEGP